MDSGSRNDRLGLVGWLVLLGGCAAVAYGASGDALHPDWVRRQQGSSLIVTQVPVPAATTAVQVANGLLDSPSSGDRRALIVQNVGANIVFCGGVATVSNTSASFELLANAVGSVSFDSSAKTALWCVATGGASTVAVIEEK